MMKGLIEQVQIEKQDLENIIKETVKSTILELGIGKVQHKDERSAFQKTELLLWNYKSFKRVIKEKEEQISDLRKYGVPHKGGAVHSYSSASDVHGLSTVEETVENAVHTVQKSVQDIMDAINKIDAAMNSIRTDEFYPILELRYFNGMSQSDIAKALNCTQQNISYHKNRLVRELSIRIFPNDVAKELLQ